MLGTVVAHAIFVVGAGGIGWLYFYYRGERDFTRRAILQATRWVAVGIVIVIAANGYVDSSLLSEQAFWLAISIVTLAITEHELLMLDKKLKDQSEDETDA